MIFWPSQSVPFFDRLVPPLENAPDTSFPLYTATKEPLMFGPNITGYVAVDDNVGRNANVCGGAFSKGAKTTGSSKGGGVNNGLYPLNLDASKSSSTYGKSTTVQPQTMRVLAFIKS